MIGTAPLKLLEAARREHGEGVTAFGGNRGMIYELMGRENKAEACLGYLRRYWPPGGSERVYLIDLDGLYMLGPSASSALVEAIHRFSKERETPVIFINVHDEALKGLRTCEYAVKGGPTFFAFDTAGHPQLVGGLAKRLHDVLHELERREQASASDLAGDNSRASVNKFSVYLQELYTARLVVRDKVGGSDRQDAERGWTYTYRPAYREAQLHQRR